MVPRGQALQFGLQPVALLDDVGGLQDVRCVPLEGLLGPQTFLSHPVSQSVFKPLLVA